MQRGATASSTREGAHIRRRYAWLAAGLIGLCNCSLAFNLDQLQRSADTSEGVDDVTGMGNPAPTGSSFPAPGPIDAPASTTDGGVDATDASVATDASAAANSSPAADASTGASPVEDDASPSGDEPNAVDDMPGDAGIVALRKMPPDRGTIEAGTPADAAETAMEAGLPTPPPAVDAGSWCAANATRKTAYCNDFDEPNSTTKGSWDLVVTAGVDCASLDSPPDAPSPPNTLLLSSPPVSSGIVYKEQFTKYPTGVNSLSLQFALKIVDFDPNGKDVSLVRIGYRNNDWGVSLDLSGTSAQLLETVPQANGGTQNVGHAVAQPALGVWTVIQFTVDSTTSTMSLSYDGEPVAIANGTISNPQMVDATFSVIVGANYFLGPLQPMKISYDNVLIDVN